MSNDTVAKLPEQLPQGETLLWQGHPSWRSLALQAFHIRKIGVYFALILVWRTASTPQERWSVPSLVEDSVGFLALAFCSLGLLALLAWIYSRTTTYTVTSRRVFINFGAALPIMLNIPFRIVTAAGMKVHRDGTADIPLQLSGASRMAYVHLWPHVRPWRLTNPEPMLRSVPDGAHVAAVLASALASTTPPSASQAVAATAPNSDPDSIPALSPVAA
jgi:hypothetical protein